MFSPRTLDLKSIALHRLIVEKIRCEPSLFQRVQDTLDLWQHETRSGRRPYFVAWQVLVNHGVEATLEMAVEDSERGQALRQASPFAGILTEHERLEFLKNWSAAHRGQP